MRKLFIALGMATMLGCQAWREAFTAHVDVVARAGAAELSVVRLSDIFAQATALPLRRDVAYRMARLWVDYTLLAQRWARGDSLLDSATILQAMWPEVQQAVTDSFRMLRVADRLPLDSATVDSAYRAGELRYIAHILRRVDEDASVEEREERRREALQLRQRLAAGGSWEEANAQNDDVNARRNNGGLGVIGRGQMVPRFENVAYALQPGELSPVTETRFGYHLILRPPLANVREEFAAAVTGEIVGRWDSTYMAKLGEERGIQVRPDAPATIREVARAPERFTRSGRVLGAFDGGRFSVAEFVRWFRVLPAQTQQMVYDAPDEQLVYLIRQLMEQELVRSAAESAGIRLWGDAYEFFRRRYVTDMSVVAQTLNISPDSLAAAGDSLAARERLAQRRVDEYLEAAATDQKPFSIIRPLLADKLRDAAEWDIGSAGLERVLERARSIRAAQPRPPLGGANGRPGS